MIPNVYKVMSQSKIIMSGVVIIILLFIFINDVIIFYICYI